MVWRNSYWLCLCIRAAYPLKEESEAFPKTEHSACRCHLHLTCLNVRFDVLLQQPRDIVEENSASQQGLRVCQQLQLSMETIPRLISCSQCKARQRVKNRFRMQSAYLPCSLTPSSNGSKMPHIPHRSFVKCVLAIPFCPCPTHTPQTLSYCLTRNRIRHDNSQIYLSY